MPKPLWENQQQTVDFALPRDVVYDMSDPGTGKTRAHLEVFDRRLKRGESGKLLVLAPKTLLESAWGEDLDEFYPHLHWVAAYAANRERAFDSDADVFVTNTDAAKWLAKQTKGWWKKRFPAGCTIVSDEHNAFKHHTSGRSRAADKVFHVEHIRGRPIFAYRTGMGATPNPNTVAELWHQMFLLDNGERLGTSFYRFRNSVCTPVQVGPRAEHVNWVDKERSEEAVSVLLSDITIRHDFDEVMDIPKNLERFMWCDLSTKLRKQYNDMEARALLELESGQEVVGINAAVLANKLCQIASGAVYHDNKGNYSLLDDSRYELIADLVEQQKHSVTFFNWSHQKHEISKILSKRGIEHAILDSTVSDKRRAALRREYQAGNFRSILLHPETGAHGLTLTRGTACIWSSPVYRADFVKQGRHRIYRGGQTRRTYTRKICARDTIDQQVYEKATAKGGRMLNLLDILRTNRKA